MTSHSCVLVLDIGTTALKGALVAGDGAVLGRAEAPLTTHHPEPGAAEQDPQQWWEAAVTVTRRCLRGAATPVALAVTGQMQDVVLLDADGRGVGPAVLYSDTRAGEQAVALAGRFPEWAETTRNAQGATSAPAVIARLSGQAQQDQRAQREWERVERIALGAPGALLARAGADVVCDLTTASTTGLLARPEGGPATWYAALAEYVGVAGLLPRLVDGVSVTGYLSADAAAEMGLPSGLPLVHAAGDAGASVAGIVGEWAVGSAVGSAGGSAGGSAVEEMGRASITVGTTAWVSALVAGRLGPHGSVHDLVGPGGNGSLGVGAMLSAGATIDHARCTYLPGLDHVQADAVALDRGPSGLLYLPSLAGERCPVRDDSARGTIVGLTAGTDGVELYRAAVEGVAFTLRHIAALLDPALVDTTSDEPMPVSGGGARSALFLQVLADTLGRPVVPLIDEHAGLRGAHRAAAHALGLPPPPPLADDTDTARSIGPGEDQQAYSSRLHAHLELWTVLQPAFAALRQPPR